MWPRPSDGAPAQWVGTCYQSGGRDISGITVGNWQKSIELCHQGTRDCWADCYIGAVKDIMWGTVEPGYAFCAAVEYENRAACYFAIGETANSLAQDRSGRAAPCSRVEEPFRDVCLRGALGASQMQPESFGGSLGG